MVRGVLVVVAGADEVAEGVTGVGLLVACANV